jgi:hypothetical protein
MANQPNTILRLSHPIDADGRRIDSLVFSGAPGCEKLPVNERDGDYELDVLELVHTMARRTGLSRPCIEKLETIDKLGLALLLFSPARSRQDFDTKKKNGR